MRSLSGRRLGSEAKRLRAAGTPVLLLQPTAEDLEVMPSNLMSRRRRREVYETARRSVAGRLGDGEAHDLLARLPTGGAAAAPPA
jgi:hypothetical protein